MTGQITHVLAVIPARSGSRRVPSKNIQNVAGQPLIVWTIDAARRAAGIERVVVSTDSEAIASIARGAGAEIPGLRPAALAADETPGTEPVLHIVRKLETDEGYRPDYVIVLQPTSPLRSATDIDGAIEMARQTAALSVTSVCRVSHTQAWLKRVGPEGALLESESTNQCDGSNMEPIYVLNGAIYLVERETLIRKRSLYADSPYAYVMPAERSLDVDTAWDLHLADLALRFPFKPSE